MKEEELLRVIGILKAQASQPKAEWNYCDREHYYNICGFLNDQEIHKIWSSIDNALERQGYNADNGELSIRVYDEELTENVEHSHDFYNSLSESYDTKVDALVDSMGVSDKLVSQRHERRDLDAL